MAAIIAPVVSPLLASVGINGGIIAGVVTGAVTGAAAGAVSGGFMSQLPGGSGDFWKGATTGAISGAIGGAVIGGIAGGLTTPKGHNIWTGNAPRPVSSAVSELTTRGVTSLDDATSLSAEGVPSSQASQSSTAGNTASNTRAVHQAPDGRLSGNLNIKGGDVISGSNRIALGVTEHLDDFAKSVKGSTWHTWGADDFAPQFLDKLNNPSTQIHFNLTGPNGQSINAWKAVQEGIRGLGASRATSWESFQIYSNSGALNRTTFYLNGKVVPSPF